MKKTLAGLLSLALAAAAFPAEGLAQVVELPVPQAAPELALPSPASAGEGQGGGTLEASAALGGAETLPSLSSLPVETLPSAERSLAPVRTLDAELSRPAAGDARTPERALSCAFDGSAPSLAVMPAVEGPQGVFTRLARLPRRLASGKPPKKGGVLPDKEANRAYWRFVISQEFLTAATQVHVVALPGVVPGSTTRSYLRIAHYGSQGVSSFVTGPWVDRVSNKGSMVWNSVGLGAVMGLIPLAAHDLPNTASPFVYALAGITAARAFFQIFAGNSSQAMFQKIVQPFPGSLNKANAVRILVDGVVSMSAAYGAGWLIERLTKGAGSIGASAWAYGVAAALAVGSALYTAWKVKEPPKGSAAFAAKNASGSKLGDYAEGFKIIAKDPFLRNSTIAGLVEMLASDAFMLLVLPGFVGTLHGSGGFGLLMSASAFGSTLAGLGMIGWGSRKAKGDPLTRLERDGKISYLLFAAGSLLCWAIYKSAGVWPAAIAYGLSTLLTSPQTVVWTSLVQHILKDRDQDVGKVYSAISVLWPVATVVGTLVFPFVVRGLSPGASMLVFSILFSVSAVLHVWGAFKLFPLKRGGPGSPSQGPKSAYAPRLAWTAGLA